MEFGALLSAAVILLTGLIVGKLAGYIHLPTVTGYLLGGLLIGPSLLGILSVENVQSMGIISEIALAFIAFSIGLSFKMSYLKRLGMTPVVIAFFEAFTAVILVQIALFIAGYDLPFVIVLGSIAAATAPASTVLVIKEYKAKGPVTDTLLSVVALDDAIALVLFGFATAIAQTLIDPIGSNSLFLSILNPFKEIGLALLLGAIAGVIMKLLLNYFTTRGGRLSILVAGVFLTSGLATQFGVSELLACMLAGLVLTNTSIEANLMGEMSDYITPPIYTMFFVLSGAQLQLSIIPTIGVMGIIYIIFRVIGKLSGAYTGAKIMKAPDNVRKYLGPMLIPQAGVAIGLTKVAERVLPTHAGEITAVILVGTLVYEFIGPIATKIALEKAGETNV